MTRTALSKIAEAGGQASNLAAKFAARTAVVGVVGLGYVGLPFAIEKARVGFHVRGIDQNPLRVESVLRGESILTPTEG